MMFVKKEEQFSMIFTEVDGFTEQFSILFTEQFYMIFDEMIFGDI